LVDEVPSPRRPDVGSRHSPQLPHFWHLRRQGLTYVEVPPERTADFAYLRFIGDHTTVPARVHGEIRLDRTAEIARWARILRESLGELGSAFAFFNNHFQGFAPDSVNLFRRVLGLAPVRYAPSAATLESIAAASAVRTGSHDALRPP
jgi:uncharacterized protein YecE (DUF72 family)